MKREGKGPTRRGRRRSVGRRESPGGRRQSPGGLNCSHLSSLESRDAPPQSNEGGSNGTGFFLPPLASATKPSCRPDFSIYPARQRGSARAARRRLLRSLLPLPLRRRLPRAEQTPPQLLARPQAAPSASSSGAPPRAGKEEVRR